MTCASAARSCGTRWSSSPRCTTRPATAKVVGDLKRLQDCLGEFQDTEVQIGEIRALATAMLAAGEAPAVTLLAMGEVTAGLAARQRAARDDFERRFAAFADVDGQRRMAALLRGRCSVNADIRDIQHQGRRREDDDGRQPRLPRGAESGLRTVLWDLDPQGAASFMFRVKPKVKGGGKALISGKRPLDDAIKGTDFDNLDLIPADFTYRNMDLLLDSAGRDGGDAPAGSPPASWPSCSPRWPPSTTRSSSTARRRSPWCRRTCCTPPTSSWCRSSRRRCPCGRSSS